MSKTIDPGDPDTWDFDAVIDALERDENPEGVDVFDMRKIVKVVECGTAACLFGSAAIAAGVKGFEQIIDLFHDWNPRTERARKIWGICQMSHLDADEVVRRYRGTG